MVKKIAGMRGEGVQKFPRCLRGLLLLLVSFTIFSSFSVPVFGADYKLEWNSCAVTGVNSMGGIIDSVATNPNFDGNIIVWSSGQFDTAHTDGIEWGFYLSGSFSSGDVITFNYANTLGGLAFNTANLRITENGNSKNQLLSSSSGTFTYSVNENCDIIEFFLTSNDLKKSPTSTSPSTRFKLTFTVETQEVGLLKSILNFIKEIPTKIGEFFTNLVNNLKDWFNSIGEWFSELGDKISGFFENLFNNIKEFFTSLFKPSDDYFTNLKNDLDAFLSQHLGIVYELPVALLNETLTIFTSFRSLPYGMLYVTVPAFEFYLLDHHYEIFEGGTFLLYQEGNMPWLDTVIDIAHVMIDIFLAIGFVRFVYKKVINKVGVEGGDEI